MVESNVNNEACTQSPTSPSTPPRKPIGLCISPSMKAVCPAKLKNIIEDVDRGLANGLEPTKAISGTSGVYLVYGPSKKTAQGVFKPADEEASEREGICSGEGCIREVAAFRLDHDGFCGVPCTTLVESDHSSFPSAKENITSPRVRALLSGTSTNKTTIGSLQMYFDSDNEVVENFGKGVMNIDQAQAIASLDIRILNADRHSGNILVKQNTDGSLTLVPIDHGYSLRDVADAGNINLVWWSWDEIKMPVTQRTFAYIESLNIITDIEVLTSLGISAMAIHHFYASSTLLQVGVKAGLSLYDIAVLCYRDDDFDVWTKVPSPLEVIVFRAFKLMSVLLKTDCRSNASASIAIANAIVRAPNTFPPPSLEASDLCELTTMSKLSISENKVLASNDWACAVVDKVLSMKYEPLDISVLEDIDDSLVSHHYREFVDSLISREISLLLENREASSETYE